VNPYFVVESPATLTGWSPLSAFTDPAVLRGRAAAVRDALGAGPVRAAASVDFLGVAARLISPVVAALVSTGTAPVLSLHTVWWRPAVPGPMRLAFTAHTRAASLELALVEPVLDPLLEAYSATFALSRKVLRGNIASARNGAESALGRGRPGFLRDSCCLLYRLPRGGVCGDCVLRRKRP
jgi:hypothetical protein